MYVSVMTRKIRFGMKARFATNADVSRGRKCLRSQAGSQMADEDDVKQSFL